MIIELHRKLLRRVSLILTSLPNISEELFMPMKILLNSITQRNSNTAQNQTAILSDGGNAVGTGAETLSIDKTLSGQGWNTSC